MRRPTRTSQAPPPRAEAFLRSFLPDGAVGLSILGDLREEFAERVAGETRAPAFWYWGQALRLAARYSWERGLRRRRTLTAKRSLVRDLAWELRYGVRMLVKAPGMASVVILTLGLAIGSNSIVFSFANLLLIRPLPVREPDRLIEVFAVDPRSVNDRARISLADFLDWKAEAETVSDLSAFEEASFTLTGHGEPVRLRALRVSADFFRAWGLEPVLGRLFAAGDDRPAAEPIVVLSHCYWRDRWESDPAILGASLMLSGTPHTVVGVLTPEIEIGTLSLVDIWTNLTLDPDSPRDRRTLEVFGRLRPEVNIERASIEFRALADRLQEQYPETNSGWGARVVSFNEAIAGPNTWLLLALLGVVVAMVFLVACANVANVLLAELSRRGREMAVRLALGAGGARLARQLAAEGLILGLAGGAMGLVFAHVGLASMRAVDAEPFFQMLFIDRNVLAFATILSISAPTLVSLLAAHRASRFDVPGSLHAGARAFEGGPQARRFRNALVVLQLSAAIALLVVSGLVVRTVLAIQSLDLGFRPQGVLMARLELDEKGYAGPERVGNFLDELLGKLRAVPGLRHPAATDRMPLLDAERMSKLAISGRPESTPSETPWAVTFRVTPDYFSAMGIVLEEGRLFDESDRADGTRVALINREMADRYWPDGRPALGSRLRMTEPGSETDWLEVVGIVGGVFGLHRDTRIRPQVYLPLSQHPERAMTLVLNATAPLAELVPRLRSEVASLDPNLALYDVEQVRGAIDRALAATRITSSMFVGFAAVALLLAAIGLYGVISYSVSVRAHEFGTRLALGARTTDIRRLVLSAAARLAVAGIVSGLAVGLALAQTIKSLLYQVSATDPLTLLFAVGLPAVVAFAASYVPAHRAARVDPLTALKSE